MTSEQAKALATELYETETCERLFETAWQSYPGYNDMGDDTVKACSYIVSGLVDMAVEQGKLSYDDLTGLLDEVEEELGEMVYAGLT